MSMADNYLENKMEALRQGRTVYRKVNPGTEALLKAISCSEENAAGDAALMSVQYEAVVRAAKIIAPHEFSFEVDESASCIRILGPSSPKDYLIRLGEVLLAMRLKAAEMHLKSSYRPVRESFPAGNRLRHAGDGGA